MLAYSELSSCGCITFLIPCSEDEDITMVRNVEICSRKYTASYKKTVHVSNVAVRILHRAYVNTLLTPLTFQRPSVTSTPLVMVRDT